MVVSIETIWYNGFVAGQRTLDRGVTTTALNVAM